MPFIPQAYYFLILRCAVHWVIALPWVSETSGFDRRWACSRHRSIPPHAKKKQHWSNANVLFRHVIFTWWRITWQPLKATYNPNLLVGQQCWELLYPCWQWCANRCNNSQQRWRTCSSSSGTHKTSTLLLYASAITEQKKCWELLAQKFDRFQILRNNSRQDNNNQKGVQTDARFNIQQCWVPFYETLERTQLSSPLLELFRDNETIQMEHYIVKKDLICNNLLKIWDKLTGL